MRGRLARMSTREVRRGEVEAPPTREADVEDVLSDAEVEPIEPDDDEPDEEA